MSDYRRGLDWSLDLLHTYTPTIRDYNLQITDTQSLLQSPLAVFGQRILI
jgi:hypothetical protein